MAMEMGIKEMLITCDSANVRSRRLIEFNGGVLEKEIDGRCWYWAITNQRHTR